mgnify:CR=1 FL=1
MAGLATRTLTAKEDELKGQSCLHPLLEIITVNLMRWLLIKFSREKNISKLISYNTNTFTLVEAALPQFYHPAMIFLANPKEFYAQKSPSRDDKGQAEVDYICSQPLLVL